MINLNKKQRKQVCSVLKLAVSELDDGIGPHRRNNKATFICLAIHYTKYKNYDASLQIKRLARSVINDRLGRHSAVCDWLRSVVGINKDLLTRQNLQEYRHRWLQELIKEFSN